MRGLIKKWGGRLAEFTWDFAETKVKENQKFANPNPPSHEGVLIMAGASSFGSHAIKVGMSCPRAFALSCSVKSPESDRSGAVRVYPDPGGVLLNGPFQGGFTYDLAQTVYMIRGTLIHIALAHAFSRLALEEEGRVVIGGQSYLAPLSLYTPAEAIEAAAVLIGPQARTFALPAARRMLPVTESWAKEFYQRERVVAVETQFAWHVTAPYTYTARYDLMVQNRSSGLLRGVDYKTSTRPSADKPKYASSAQLHGQDIMGRTRFGEKWDNVAVLFLVDPGEKSQAPTTVEEWRLPKSHVAGALRGAIERSQNTIAPYVGMPVEQWPANPFGCGDCRVQKLCKNTSVGF